MAGDNEAEEHPKCVERWSLSSGKGKNIKMRKKKKMKKQHKPMMRANRFLNNLAGFP